MKTLTNEIEKLTTGRVRNAQRKLDEVTAQLDKVRSEITKLGVAIKTAERFEENSIISINNGSFIVSHFFKLC